RPGGVDGGRRRRNRLRRVRRARPPRGRGRRHPPLAQGLQGSGRTEEQRALTIAPRRAPSRRRVVVSGVGMITPLGRNTRETFERASQSCSGIDYIRGFDTRGLPVRIGAEVADQWIRRPPGGPAGTREKIASRAV